MPGEQWERFQEFYAGYLEDHQFDEGGWQELQWDFVTERVPLPYRPGLLPKGLLNALYSTKFGKVFGWDYSNFIQIANHMEPGLRECLHYIRKGAQGLRPGGVDSARRPLREVGCEGHRVQGAHARRRPDVRPEQ